MLTVSLFFSLSRSLSPSLLPFSLLSSFLRAFSSPGLAQFDEVSTKEREAPGKVLYLLGEVRKDVGVL